MRCALWGFSFLILVISAAVKTKQFASLGGHVYREAPQGAMRFVGFSFLMLVIPAAVKTKQFASLGGYVYRGAPQGAMRFVGFFFFDVGDSSCREKQANRIARRLRLQRSPTRCDALCGVFLFGWEQP